MSPLAMLFLVFYGVFALATPVLVIALYVRYNKLQARVKAAEEESARLAAGLRYEIADLQRQVAAQKSAEDKALPAAPKAIACDRLCHWHPRVNAADTRIDWEPYRPAIPRPVRDR